MQHYYLCNFKVYKLGETNRHPYCRPHFIRAGNAMKAYRKAQEICETRYLKVSGISDTVQCRHSDIRPALKEEALAAVKEAPEMLIEKYMITETPNGGTPSTVKTFFGSIKTALVNLRSEAFDRANSGKYGIYPDDIETFDEEVEEGFSDDGMSWDSHDGHRLEIRETQTD